MTRRSGACQAEGAFADCMPSFAVAHGAPGPNAVGAPTAGARTIWTRVEHFLVSRSCTVSLSGETTPGDRL